VLGIGSGLVLALAAGVAGAGVRSASAPDAAAHRPDPARLVAGLDTLEDPADRALPLVGRPHVFVPDGGVARLRANAREVEARRRLGPGWRLESLGAGPDSWALRGPAVRLPEGAGYDALRGIASRLPSLFGPDAGLRLEPVFDRAAGASGVVRMRQVEDGARVAGGDVIASFDADGRLTMLASSYRPDLDLPAGPSIAMPDAEDIARADLLEAQPGVTILGVPRSEPWIWPREGGGFARVWLVRQATRNPWGSFVTRIDAATGAVLARENSAQRKTRTGEGIVYRSNLDYPNRPRPDKIKDLQGADIDPEGHLEGMHVRVLDEKGNRVASTKLRYLYYPFEEWDAFDQVSTYYHLQRAHERFRKALGVRGLPWFDGPEPVAALANVRNLCDAYYSTDFAGDGKPGFAFGDQMACGATPNEDYARDSDVVYHEYSHAIVDWQGIGLQDAPLDSYQRAIGEADADYHAAEFTGDPTIGEVVGFPRSIATSKTYPANVACWYGSPQEHCTGQIWSSLLWDLRSAVGRAEQLEFVSLDYLVDHPGSSHAPVWLDFWDAAVALLDADEHLNGGKNAGIIYGLAASRGIFGPLTYPGDNLAFPFQGMGRGTRFKSIGWVGSGEGTGVPYYFSAPAGSTVSIKVKTTSGLHPDFLLGEALGYPLEYFTVASDKDAEQATLVTDLPAVEGLYVVTVRGAGGTAGSFQISIVVKR
jgi:hypothetical protein